MPLVNRYEIVSVVPCLADSVRIRVTAQLDADIGEALPYVNAVLKRAVFNAEPRTLTVIRAGMCFSLHTRRIAGAKLRDLDHAREELEWWLALINDTWERRATITPSYERGQQLSAIQIFKGLPATNCKACGEATCLAFAAKLLGEKASVLSCTPLFTPEWREKRVALLELLEGAGYQIPPEFLA
jgi:ArsR family metal-binding transcriptional regulator